GLVIATFASSLIAGVAIAAALAVSFGVTFAHLGRLAAQTPLLPARLRVDRNFQTVLLSRASINLGFYTFVGFLFFFVRDVVGAGNARQTTGILFLAFTLAGVIGAAFAGRTSDRIDKRVVVSVAGVGIAIALGALAGANSLWAILLFGALAGIAWGAFFTADWAIAYVVLPADSMAAAMGVWNLAAALPQIAAPLLGAAIVSAAGIRAVQIAVIVEFALGTFWLWRLPVDLTGSTSSGIESVQT
ncbi:MAG: MFS transporter, partial [Polyangiaceae bacterium]